jgi:hypothetical protein
VSGDRHFLAEAGNRAYDRSDVFDQRAHAYCAQRRRHAIGVTVQQHARHDDGPAARGKGFRNGTPSRRTGGKPVQQDHRTRTGEAGEDLRAHRRRYVRFGVLASAEKRFERIEC